MKALSILPEFTLDIFMGEKAVEYRTWQTDYRGDLLVCASSKKRPGYVCGYAFLVVPLLEIRAEEQPVYSDDGKPLTQYDWILGAPKLIKPIPVKGKLHLFDVDDALIEYVDGGDLGAYASKEEADAFRTGYMQQYLEPLACKTKDGGEGLQTVILGRQIDRILLKYADYNDSIIGLSFTREPFAGDFRGWAGITDDAAFVSAFEAFMAIAHETFRWNDYLQARMTAEQAFRTFYARQGYPQANLEEALNGFIVSFFSQNIDECQFQWEDEHPGMEMPEPAEDDIDALYLARCFAVIHEFTDKAADVAFCESIGVQYHYEQLHMCCWFAGQVTHGFGKYTRSEPNFSARNTYNHLMNPWSLLWIGVVLGADRDALKAAAGEMAGRKANSAKCAVMRRHVPFDAILAGYDKLMYEEDGEED